jgi:WD40 repeat protein
VEKIDFEGSHPVNDPHKLRGGRILSVYVAFRVMAAFSSLVLLPLSAYCASGSDFISKILGSNMNDVAAKVAELPKTEDDELVLDLTFSPDGSQIAVDSNNLKVNIWDWEKRRLVKTVEKPHGSNNLDAASSIRYSPDGSLLAVCVGKAVGNVVVRIWETANWSISKDLVDSGAGGCDGIAFTPNGRLFVRIINRAGNPGDNVIVYDVPAWKLAWGLSIENFSVASVAISPDGETAAIGGILSVVPWDVKDPIERVQKINHRPQIHLINLQQRKTVKVIEAGTMGPIAWSPDGTRLALAGGPVEIFDSRSGENLLREKSEKSGHMHAQYTPDGRYFIACDMNGRGTGLGVKIWDSEHRQLLQEIAGNVGNIGVSRDSKYLAVGIPNHISIWQLK